MDYTDEGYPPIYILREISILRRFKHPNIIPLLGLVTSKHAASLILPFASRTLRDLKVPKYKKINIAYDLCHAVAYLHPIDIIHRDIKPDNILYFEENDQVKLADFGISRTFECGYEVKSFSNAYSLWFRSPEILMAAGSDTIIYDEKSDIWALGCTLFKFLDGSYFIYTDNDVLDLDIDEQSEIALRYIFAILGNPSKDIWSNLYEYPLFPKQEYKSKLNSFSIIKDEYGSDVVDLIKNMLILYPKYRYSAKELLKLPVFSKIDGSTNIKINKDCYEVLRLREAYPLRKSKNNYKVPIRMLKVIKYNPLYNGLYIFFFMVWMYDLLSIYFLEGQEYIFVNTLYKFANEWYQLPGYESSNFSFDESRIYKRILKLI